MNRKPIIGVTPSVNNDQTELRLPRTYMNAVEKCGGIPFLFNITDSTDNIIEILSICDGIVLSGGVDIDPVFFGEELLFDNVDICKIRDDFELKLAKIAIIQNKPIFGICRGIQVLNVALGGTLYQDIPSQIPESKVCHQSQDLYPKNGHYITVFNDTNNPFYKCFNEPRLYVNSYHHQAIKDIAPALKIGAISEEDNVIEAVYHTENSAILGVQWHPEKLFDEKCNDLFKMWLGNIDK